MFESFIKQNYRNEDDLDLSKCPECGGYFWDKNQQGICDSCRKRKEEGKKAVGRMADSITALIDTRKYR